MVFYGSGQHHIGVKRSASWLCLVACIFMSYALFAVYTFTEKSTRKIQIPVSFFLPYGSAVSFSTVEFVTVEIYGLKEEIAQIHQNDLIAYVDVNSHAVKGQGDFPIFLKRKQSLAGERAFAFSMKPGKVRLFYEEQIAKNPGENLILNHKMQI